MNPHLVCSLSHLLINERNNELTSHHIVVTAACDRANLLNSHDMNMTRLVVGIFDSGIKVCTVTDIEAIHLHSCIGRYIM